MKLHLTVSSFLLITTMLLTACSDEQQHHAIAVSDSVVIIDTLFVEESDPCDIVYDTITNEKYKMHRVILDRYTIPKKRGYWMTAGGDTLDTYLYPQDIHVWLVGLDSNEQGVYRTLTNKIVFMILQHEGPHLEHGIGMQRDHLSYFLWHVQHPMCSNVPTDSIIANVQQYIPEKTAEWRMVKEMMLYNLKHPEVYLEE